VTHVSRGGAAQLLAASLMLKHSPVRVDLPARRPVDWPASVQVPLRGAEKFVMNARFVARRGFSLIELVIVVVIIGIIAAIAIPRASRGSAAAADSALIANLTVLRSSIDLYATEHGGQFPQVAKIADQLTQYTDDLGTVSTTRTGAYVYGTYIRAIPSLNVGAKKGQSGIAAADGATIGWIYTEATGSIRANTTVGEVDARGVAYSTY
jgi:prepilin-type N-terminal cleavage/methylation domain-containing protein